MRCYPGKGSDDMATHTRIIRDMDITAPSGQRWKIRHYTRAERWRRRANLAALIIFGTALNAVLFAPLVLLLFGQ
jgi:hypothetical protein